jgi:hypothetical protein
VIANPERRHFFVVAADLADHHDRIGFIVFVEELQYVDVLQAIDWITSDPNSARLPQSQLGQLSHCLVRQRAGTRDDADTALAVNVARHDADLQFVGRDRARAIRTKQQRAFGVLTHLIAHYDHIAHGNAFGDADNEVEIGVDRFPDRVRSARRWNVDHRNVGAGLLLRFHDGAEDRNTLEIFAGPLWIDARNEARAAVCILTAHSRVKLAGLASDALRDDARVFVDQDAHCF